MKKTILLIALFCATTLGLSSLPSLAAGPDSVAKPDRSLWPDPINTVAGYNRASRAEILVFANALAELSGKDDATLMSTLHIKSVDNAAIRRVRERLLNRLFSNFKAAQSSCIIGELLCDPVDTVPSLIESGHNLAGKLPQNYSSWLNNASTFHRLYASELVRLAALFPKVSSEIETYGPEERSGFELPDGHFLWTFDDGPSNNDGTTDSLLPVLRQNDIHGIFYLLGDRVQKRLQSDSVENMRKIYSGQCLSLHGWLHNSHQRWDQWQTSVLDTQRLVKETWPQAYRPYFRPPYGQRLANSGEFFASNHLIVALWNIDSQDWNAKVSNQDSAQRVLNLMLLWRSGVILFHDVHTKAVNAVPWIIEQTKQSGITWDDCHHY